MPGKSKEDTWGAKELSDSIRDARSSGKSRPRDKERDKEKTRDKEKDRDRHREKDRERDREKDKERHRNKDRDKEKDRDKHRDRDRDKERERHSDKEREKDKDKHRNIEKDRDREREKKDKDQDKNRDRDGERHRDKDIERRKDRESDSLKEKGKKEKSKHRDRDSSREKDREKRDKSYRDKRSSDNKDSSDKRSDAERKERHREKEDKKREREKGGGSRDAGEKSNTKDEARDRRKDEKRHRDKDRERKREKEGTDSDRERRKHRDKDSSSDRRKREKSGERRHRDRDKEEKQRPTSEHKNGCDELLEKEEKKEIKKHEKKREGNIEDDVREDIQKVQLQEVQQMGRDEQDGYDDYEDDFEDYDDDFEEDDDDEEENDTKQEVASDIDELRRAIAAENQAMRRSADSRESRSERSSASNTRLTTSRTGRTFINFVAAKQRQISDQVSQQTRKRGQELMNLIDLDVAGYDLFDMPPVREYDRYIASFGRSNTKQAFVQCNEDNLDRDVQTEEIEVSEKWTQHPPEGAMICGGSNARGEEADELAAEKQINSLHFTHFMEKVTQLFTVLLDEQMANRVGGQLESNQRNIVFSDGYTLMNTGTPILQGRCVTKVIFHPVQTNLILTMHSMPKAKVIEKAGLTNRGLMCVWNVNEPSRPQKILVLKSVPKTCAFSPSKATMAFCGTLDGSVCVWDLREPSSMHQKCEFGWGHVVVRVPTYSTEAGTPDESHHSQVVAMQPIVSADDAHKARTKTTMNDDSIGLSFQLASVDEKGTISFWVVIEIDKPDDAGSESDLGLVPGGRIKLIKSSSIQLQVPLRELGPVYQLKVTDMQLMPNNPNHFFVATDAGFASHSARNTERVSPKYFWVNDGIPVGIAAIAFSPFNLPCFLVACRDGSIQLFSTERGAPLASWSNSTLGMEIVALSWSQSRPSVFFVMDTTSKVYVWELLENDAGPVKTEQFTCGRLTALSLGNDHAATGWGAASRKPEMVITDEMGSLDVHRLNSRFCTATASELDSFNNFLERLI